MTTHDTTTGAGLMSRGVFRLEDYADTPTGFVMHPWHEDIAALDAPDLLPAGSTVKTPIMELALTSVAFRV